MTRSQIGILVGVLMALIWSWLGFAKLIFVLLAGLIGYIVASLTGSSTDLATFRKQVNRLLGQRTSKK